MAAGLVGAQEGRGLSIETMLEKRRSGFGDPEGRGGGAPLCPARPTGREHFSSPLSQDQHIVERVGERCAPILAKLRTMLL